MMLPTWTEPTIEATMPPTTPEKPVPFMMIVNGSPARSFCLVLG